MASETMTVAPGMGAAVGRHYGVAGQRPAQHVDHRHRAVVPQNLVGRRIPGISAHRAR